MEKEGLDTALFAPDYGGRTDEYLVDAAIRTASRHQIQVLISSTRNGHLATNTEQSVVRDMILHGLIEIFERQLTPLGIAAGRRLVREHIS